jgi:cobalt transporter subunit CbtB
MLARSRSNSMLNSKEGISEMLGNTTTSRSAVQISSAARTSAVVPALMAALLGLFMVWGVGFSPISAIHNAAHDVRHATAFPCH